MCKHLLPGLKAGTKLAGDLHTTLVTTPSTHFIIGRSHPAGGLLAIGGILEDYTEFDPRDPVVPPIRGTQRECGDYEKDATGTQSPNAGASSTSCSWTGAEPSTAQIIRHLP